MLGFGSLFFSRKYMSWTVPLNFSQPMCISSQLTHFSWSRTWPQLMVSSSNPFLLRIGPFFFSETGPLRIHVGHFRWGWNQPVPWSSNLYHLFICIWIRVATKIRFRPNLHYFAKYFFQKTMNFSENHATFPSYKYFCVNVLFFNFISSCTIFWLW